jgi:hypothetical protein
MRRIRKRPAEIQAFRQDEDAAAGRGGAAHHGARPIEIGAHVAELNQHLAHAEAPGLRNHAGYYSAV